MRGVWVSHKQTSHYSIWQMHFLDPTDPSTFNFRVSVTKPQTWVLSVCQSYVDPYVAAGHLYCAPLLPSRVLIVLPHSVSFIEQVCPTGRPHLSNAYRGRGRMATETLEERAAALCCLHVAIPHSRSPQKVLHSPKTSQVWMVLSTLYSCKFTNVNGPVSCKQHYYHQY